MQMKPDDMDLKNDMKNLSAQEAMEKGKYNKSFRESVRDMGKQQSLLEEEKDNKSVDHLAGAITDAQRELALSPTDPGKISRLVEALRRRGTKEDEERAGQVLFEAYEKTGAFRFRLTMIDMRLKQLAIGERELRAQVVAAPTDTEKKDAYTAYRREQLEEELTLYQEVSEQYPTETKYRFEMAKRLSALDRQIDAIPLFQQSVSDPKLRTQATLQLGKTFLDAGFPDEAADTLKGLMESYPAMAAGDEIARETTYFHGRACEAKGDNTEALKSYSQVLKWDFNYRDARNRVQKLRAPTA
jgi:tetratricopeptide (TPR) repeat protein